MTDDRKGPQFTTASVESVPRLEDPHDPTPGLVLVYSRLHAHLPSAFPFPGRQGTIGREADNTLCIPEAAISRYHARIESQPDGDDWIVDLGSTNGTLVNGRRVQSQPLREHDVVRVGDTLFRYAPGALYMHTAYRLDGTVVAEVRPVHHDIRKPLLTGGYQIDALLERIEKVGASQLSVVVQGESGTGKELVARQLHQCSARSGPFQAINCAALPAHLIESELFGYRKGAFTGAATDKKGLVKAADGGTLFLDEIGDLPLEAQAKLLRVLQEKEVLPLGSTTADRVDVRIVCATHQDLDRLVEQSRFRGDLLARLRECTFQLPPLRRRLEDLFPLVQSFLRDAGHSEVRVGFSYMLALAHHSWPYNVRELQSAVRLSLALSEDGELDVGHLPEAVQHALDGHGAPSASSPAARSHRPPAPGSTQRQPPSEQELRELLEQHRGNVAAVGRELGKERMQVHRWLKRYAIDLEEYRR
jgi:DNA-binding NtrC family response regulator